MNARSNYSTPVVPATVTRRQALRSLGDGATLGLTGAVIVATTSCMPSEALAAEADPVNDLHQNEGSYAVQRLLKETIQRGQGP